MAARRNHRLLPVLLALLAQDAAAAEPLTGQWQGKLAKSGGPSSCTQLGVEITVFAGGVGKISFDLAGEGGVYLALFVLGQDGAFSAAPATSGGARPTVSGMLTATGGRVAYDNPAGCAYAGEVRHAR